MKTRDSKMQNDTVLVTGGAGFIGSAVVRNLISNSQYKVVNVDKLTYAGHLSSLGHARDSERHIFEKVDICDAVQMNRIVSSYRPRLIMHLAAESHVDRSIDGPDVFVQTNVVGTYTLLEAAYDYYQSLPTNEQSEFVFHHISTDEVYGSLGPEGYFTENTPYRPNSPYSATKAAADHLVRAWHKTYGLPTVISNCSNNYGPCQHPEKLIPLMIGKALAGEKLPVYGKGQNVRDWLYVEDHATALLTIAREGVPGEVYNVGGHNELTNITVVQKICEILDDIKPKPDGGSYQDQISFVQDRPGHDLRYAIDASKIKDELGWTPAHTFDTGLRETIEWYLSNTEWLQQFMRDYGGERLGLAHHS